MDTNSIAQYRAAEAALWQANGWAPIERWVDVPGRGIRVRVLDGGIGPAVLFVHGGPNAATTWAGLAGRLPGFRCLAVDRPGAGLSEPLDYDGLLIGRAMVDVQTAVLDSLGLDRVDMIGSSFGGACVLWFAQGKPDRVGRIVLEGTPAIEGMRLAMNLRTLAIGPLGRFIARRRASRGMLRMTFRQIGHGALIRRGWPEGVDLGWGLAMMNDTDTMRHEVDLIQHVATWRGFGHGLLFDPAGLMRIAAPTLWLWGERDPFGRVEQGRQWAASMSAGTFESFADAGHLPWLDDPATHAARIAAFLGAEAPAPA